MNEMGQVDELRKDQRERWERGDRILVEAYLEKHPELEADGEGVLDLVYSEIVLRESLGETPAAEEYVRRFPRLGPRLERQFALDRALDWKAFLSGDPPPEPIKVGEGADTLPEGAIRAGGPAAETEKLTPYTDAPVAPGLARVTVPGYEILEELGRGGMGVVYKARQVGLKRLVALKMILAGEYAAAQELTRFRREAEAVARLHHPHIVQIYEVGEQEGRPFFSLEYIDGGSLAAKLNGTPLPSRPAAQLVETLARAVHHAHQQGIVHRDLKPANVLLRRKSEIRNPKSETNPNNEKENSKQNSGGDSSIGISNLKFVSDFGFRISDFDPKITDFGLAKRLHGEQSAIGAGGATQSGQIVGTPSYMAPEQALGQAGKIGPAVDVYALGAILYEMLTGRPPFKAATALDTMRHVIGEEPVPPRRLQPRLPRDLDTICLKCLEKEPAKRYGSAEALAEDLRRYLASEPILARPAGPWRRLVKSVQRRPALAALLGLIVLVPILAFAGVLWHLRETMQEQQQTESALEKAESNLYLNYIALAAREWAANNVDRADQLLNRCPERLRNWEWHYLKRLCHLEQHTFNEAGGFGLAFSPDGKRLASASVHDKTVKVLDPRTGNILARFPDAGPCVAFSSDGLRLASATFQLGKMGNLVLNQPATVKVWNVLTGKEELSLEGHQRVVWCLAFSPDGQRLASASWDNTVKIWNAKTGKLLHNFQGHSNWVQSVAFTPDSAWVASASTDGTVKIWEAATGAVLLSLKNTEPDVDRVRWGFRARKGDKGEWISPDQWDTTLKIWDATTSTEVPTLRGQAHQVYGVAFNPRKQQLAFTAGDTIKVVDYAFGLPGREVTLRGHTDLVRCVAFSSDGKRLASAGSDKSVKVWDAEIYKEVFTLPGHTAPVNGIAFSRDGRHLATAGWDRTVRIWNATAGGEARRLGGQEELVRTVAFSPDGRRLASAGLAKTILIWTLDGTTAPVKLAGHSDLVRSLAFSPDGQRLASASYDKTVILWDLGKRKPHLFFRGHKDRVFGVAFSSDGRRVVSAGQDGTAKVWDAATGHVSFTFTGHKDRVHAVAFSPDGRRVASAGDDRVVRVWDAATGDEILVLQGHKRDIIAVAFSPEGGRLASAGLDQTIRIWDAGTGKALHTLEGHTEGVIALAFRSDGQRLASGSMDRSIKIWDVSSGQEALTLRGAMQEVLSVAFSPNGGRLASGHTDGAVLVWEGRE